MTIELNKFVKGKHLKAADFNFDDPSDTISVKTDATSAVGTAIAAAALVKATSAENIAGVEDTKFLTSKTMSDTLQAGVNYPIHIHNPTAATAYNLGAVFLGESDASGPAAQTARFLLTTGTVGTANVGFTNAVIGVVYTEVTTPSGMRSQGGHFSNSSSGAGMKVGVSGDVPASGGGTNIGVYGRAANGANNWAGYFDGDVKLDRQFIGTTANPMGYNGAGKINMLVNDGSDGVNIKNDYPDSRNTINLWTTNTATWSEITFYKGTSQTQVGSIATSTTGTTYNTVSDYRLKIVDGLIQNSGSFIDSLKPYVGEWKAEPGKKAAFFLAHEVQEVSPSSVHGEKDAVDEDGKPVMQSMEYGSAEFIVNIIAELQSLRKRVAELEAAK